MNTIDHAKRAHALISMSGMERTVNCPPSVVLGLDLPDLPATEASIEGTAAHEVAEMMLKAKLEETPYPEIDLTGQYDEHMVRCGKAYAEYLYSVIEPMLEFEHTWAIEKKVIADESRDIWGTIDFIFIYIDEEKKKNVLIFDYKYGMKKVSPKKNWQVSGYGYAAYKTWGRKTLS